jgi:hypothetical protein
MKSAFIPWDHSGTEFFKTRIADLESVWRAGSPLALNDAANLCKEFGCAVWPEWVLTALATEHEAVLAGRKHKKQGRQASVEGFERDRHKHLLRWHNARIALANRERLPADGFEPTWEGAFEWVSNLLKGTPGQGEPPSIKRSYTKVEKAIREGKGARFGMVPPEPEVAHNLDN